MGFLSRQCLSNVGLLSKILVLLLFCVFVASSLSSRQQKPSTCHDEESTALLQFKQSFVINISDFGFDGSYPKVSSWKAAEGDQNINCCSWDGVECDEETGHVIGLDVSSSCLYGSINSSSSLFHLVHLRRLNLAENNFNYSQIPTTIRNLPRLRYLNLSSSRFSGQVPSEISQLSKLSSLDLSGNLDTLSNEGLLKLKASNLANLVQNLTSLEKLHLTNINISSTIPDSLANLSFLSSLALRNCDLYGEFPIRIFKLQYLAFLSVRFNQELSGYLPDFNGSSPLTSLILRETNFSRNLPSSIGNLEELTQLDLRECKFSGPIPASLANLTQLSYLSLGMNDFVGGSLSWLGKQTKLTLLNLDSSNLSGFILSSLGNLTQLTHLSLKDNQLSGPIPSLLGNLSRLTDIGLDINSLNSSIPESLFNLMDLVELTLAANYLHGKLDICKLQSSIAMLQLGENKLEVSQCNITNTTLLPKFKFLGLSYCNIKEFPDFLRHQQSLTWLDLFANKLHGQIPKWMWNTSTQSLKLLDLRDNFLSRFGHPNVVLPWVNLQVLVVSDNLLDGSPPIPPQNIIHYQLHGNKLTGKLSPLMCNISTFEYFDLSNNMLSGTIPPCLGNFSDDLQVLNLRNNSFHGILPQTYSKTSSMEMLDVSYNQLHGKIPSSLVNCVMLESLVLSVNKFSDVFPFWLGSLPKLKLLAMHHNEFYGVIENTKENLHFPELRILDLSYNHFSGEFPSKYIFSGNAMRGIVLSQPTYMMASSVLNIPRAPTFEYNFEVTISNKGVERYYSRIQDDLAVIDISSNNFQGKIPEFIGNLKGIRFLNISNNIFNGSIPSFLENLTLLEALDLSQNQLSGEIPQQLAQLTYLANFNVSYNNLTGSVPQGPQFHTFDSTSFEGNPGLCGGPLPKKCGNSNAPAQLPPSSSIEEAVSGFAFEFDLKFVLAGFGSGLLVGVVLADVAITRRRELFLEIVGMLIRLMKRIKRQRRY
ncbi:putative leucine-rich repeat-containing, plant-type, leucine-rich repeat domain, L [Rosa chinensis]|uniref:Putative leucine-rich repeat-containing, plant-type, leucine-rich repeat domain, L n=1 Tax=Rosa chinensis TaxID=74649 RepID=A0A2P6RH28_ROSCH|nr:receptor-like protein 6 [Rosa chinensis]PRQ45740.1 putative leucine-rich repeat-containing, plant-type, leucine-rich repeat domain, L [Rosa chinensis]